MSKIFVEDTEMRDIADAIREKNGTENTYKPSEMPQAIKDIQSGGSFYDDFWDGYQYNGTRLNYVYSFYGYGWTDVTFKPKYDLKPTNATAMFSSTQIKNMKKCLEDAGVVLDTSKCTNFNSFITTSAVTHLPTISFEGLKTNGNTSSAFSSATQLQYIEKIITRKDVEWNASIFQACARLTTIEKIEGEIGTSFNISPTYLLDDLTINNIINALIKFEGTGTPPTLTFHSIVKNKLTETQIATITIEKGWTLA